MSIRRSADLIDEFLAEGRRYIDEGNSIQASEKLYKAVEECVKLLAEKENLPEHKEFQKEGRWWSRLLSRTARTLSRKLEEKEIGNAWARAFELHTWGFHERALSTEDIKQDIPYIEWLVDYTKKAISK